MTLRPHIAPPSSSLPLPVRLALPVACALALLVTSSCDSSRRTDSTPPPRAASLPAPSARAAAPAPDPSKAPLSETPSPSASPAARPECPASFVCEYTLWNSPSRPAIDQVFVQKGPHKLHLVAGNTILRTYSVALGWGGMGPKKYEGDGVTPTGTYKITDRLTSKWHTFLGVSYPSLEDQLEFPKRRARGEVPPGVGIGFGIALHGHADSMSDGEHKKSDWTLGCIALDNPEIDELASVVKRGTKIVITD